MVFREFSSMYSIKIYIKLHVCIISITDKCPCGSRCWGRNNHQVTHQYASGWSYESGVGHTVVHLLWPSHTLPWFRVDKTPAPWLLGMKIAAVNNLCGYQFWKSLVMVIYGSAVYDFAKFKRKTGQEGERTREKWMTLTSLWPKPLSNALLFGSRFT